jgi:hypothetical protein
MDQLVVTLQPYDSQTVSSHAPAENTPVVSLNYWRSTSCLSIACHCCPCSSGGEGEHVLPQCQCLLFGKQWWHNQHLAVGVSSLLQGLQSAPVLHQMLQVQPAVSCQPNQGSVFFHA